MLKTFLAVLMSASVALAAKPSAKVSKECNETANYDLGFNHGKNGKDLSTPDVSECPAKNREKLTAAYRKGFKEALALTSKTKEASQAAPVQVIVNTQSDTGYLTKLPKCSDFKKDQKNCFISHDGEMRGQCEVCREGKSCFISLNGKARALCEAYVEKKSCFMSLTDSNDRAWCEHFREGKSCSEAFGIGGHAKTERARCERGEVPSDHYFWLN